MAAQEFARLLARQDQMASRRQLRDHGITWRRVRDQIAALRWADRSERVISTFTGPLTPEARRWLGVLHAGSDALIGGLTAAAVHGLQNWERDEVTVMVDEHLVLTPVPGIRFARTRRDLRKLRDPRSALPVCRIEPAALLFAGYTRSKNTANGLLAAVVQQRLTTPSRLLAWLDRLQPLRRAGEFRVALSEIEAGAESWNEMKFGRLCRRFGVAPPDRQVRHRRADGRNAYVDCRWRTAQGHLVILEINGPVHMNADRWQRDVIRQRQLARPDHVILTCTTWELADSPENIFADLIRLGVPQISSRS